jgi:hypothetical protein
MMTALGREPARRRCVVIITALVAALLAACDASAPPTPDETLPGAWQELQLPTPPDGWRNDVRALTACDGTWYATGALMKPQEDPKPAAWTSSDGRTWAALTIKPETYYGERNIIYAAACRAGRLVAIGGKAGGAHGNPRLSTWYTDVQQQLTEVEARPYTIFGGEDAVNTSRIAAGPTGWLLAGNRTSGAAAWFSSTGERFDLIENAPGLASTNDVETYATDVIALGNQWLMIGARTAKGGTRDPSAWIANDLKNWRVEALPATDRFEEMQRATAVGDTILGVGPQGDHFASWRREADGTWHEAGAFGAVAGTIPGSVTALVAHKGQAWAVVRAGSGYEIWTHATAWRPVRLPVAGASEVTAYDDGTTLIVATSDQIWRWTAN